MFGFLGHKAGGSWLGNLTRRLLSYASNGMTDTLGITDGHSIGATPAQQAGDVIEFWR